MPHPSHRSGTVAGISGRDSQSTASSVLRGARANQPEAWQRLLDLYGQIVFDHCCRRGLSSADAADVMQSVFYAVYLNIDQFRYRQTGDTFRGWLWSITRNKLTDHFRGSRRTPVAVGGSDAYAGILQIPDPVESPADDGDVRAEGLSECLLGDLDTVRACFEPRSWRAFELTELEGMRSDLAADELGMTVAAVYTAKSRVRRKLREYFQTAEHGQNDQHA
ncbi:MAG: sigma-70 family RNA polymerase sigma factor [Planctomycetaceae bacterium]